jgi:hypothetical protein
MRRDRRLLKVEVPMSTTEVPGRATSDRSITTIDMGLETVVIPVSDVDRAKAFHEGLGWRLDARALGLSDYDELGRDRAVSRGFEALG